MKKHNSYFADVSCLGKIRLSGKSAFEFVKVMTTVDLRRIETPAEATMALVLNAEGEILDLVMIARTGEQEFILITNPHTVEELTEWLQAHAELLNNDGDPVFADIKVENSTRHIGTFALYGPESQMVLNELSRIDISEELGDKNLTLITIGELQVMIIRWPLLRRHGQNMPLRADGEVFEVYLPVKASDDFKEILLGFVELDPESFEEYVERRLAVHTWFDAAEQAAYIKPETAELKALMRPGTDFVGAKALVSLGILSHPTYSAL